MYYLKNFGVCFRATFAYIRDTRRFAKSSWNTAENNTNKDSLPSFYGSFQADINSSQTLEKSAPKSPFPVLLPSDEEKLRIFRLNNDISNTKNLNELLDIYIQSKGCFDCSQYVLTIIRLTHFYNHGEFNHGDLLENLVFQSICYDVWKIITQLETTNVLSLYGNFLDLKINSSYIIMQGLLQMMRHQINLFNLKELLFLDKLIERTEPCNLKDGLKIAIPRAVENYINTYLPPNFKGGEYIQLLKLCSIGQVKGIEHVLELLYNHVLPKMIYYKQRDTFTYHLINFLSIFLELLLKNKDPPFSEDYFNLIKILSLNCFQELGNAPWNDVDKDIIMEILDKSSRCTEIEEFIIPQVFLSKLAHNCTLEKWSIDYICRVIKYHLELGFVSDELISSAISYLNERRHNSFDYFAPSLILAMATSGISPEEKQHAAFLIMKHHLKVSPDNLQVPWFKILLNLLSFNYLPEDILKSVLNEDFLYKYFLCQSDENEYIALMKLDGALKALQWNTEAMAPENLLISLFEKHLEGRQYSSLRPALVEVIGNEHCLISDIITPRRMDLDHFLVLDRDGRPIPFGVDKNLENIKLGQMSHLAGKQKIAIIEIPNEWTCSPGFKLKGEFALELNIIQKEGFEVIRLYEHQIKTLEPGKLLFYLKETLQNAGVII